MGLVGKDAGKDAGKDEQPEDPPVVKQLKELDDKYLELEREFEREVQKLQLQYTEKQQPLLNERKKILTTAEGDDAKTGTPALVGFWMKALQNHPAFEDAIQEWDKPVLEYLTDCEKALLDETDNNKGFKLTFHFSENPYFTNTELTKEYSTEEANPYCGEIEVKEIKSSIVNWKEGKDVTVEKVVKKAKGGKAKNRKAKATESIEPRPSFFREFFRNLKSGEPLPADAKEQAMGLAAENEDDEEDEDDDEALCEYLMENDHEVGSALRDHIIPFAVRWYTGEAAPETAEDDSDEEDEEDDDEDDSDDSGSDDVPKGKGRGKAKAQAKKQAGGGGGKKASPEMKPKDAPKEECKQQ